MSAGLRASGLSPLGELPWGSHYGHVYRDHDELLGTVVPWFQAGLARNERCLLFSTRPGDSWAALAGALPGAEELRRARRIDVIDRRGGFLPSQRPTAAAVYDAVESLERGALRDGFDGVRLAGEVCGVTSPWTAVTAYEAHLGAALAGHRVMVLCSYCASAVDGFGILDVVALHEGAVAAGLDGHTASSRVLRADSMQSVELRAALRRVETFMAMVGHDLRNPLGAIIVAAELLLRVAAEERLLRPARRILRSANRMASMIADIVDVARVRAGRPLLLSRGRADLEPLARAAIEELEAIHPHRLLRLACHGDATASVDEPRLLQVLSNLIGNALVHGNLTGPVDVEIDGDDTDRLRLRVHNDGTVPPPLLGTLFEPFRATDERGPNARQNLGLGLFICGRIVEAHGGTIRVESSAADGTTFVVDLPR